MAGLPTFEVRLLGRFRLFRDGVEITAPYGHAGTAFKILVLNGGVVHRTSLAEYLWPDAPALGQARLRNVLHRARETGATIESHGGQTVVMANSFSCDLLTFVREGTRVLSAATDAAAARQDCLRLQALWAGPPLEDHRYAGWAEPWRRRADELQAHMWKLIERPVGEPPFGSEEPVVAGI